MVLYIQTVVFSPDFWSINSINRRIAILLVTSFGGAEDAEVTPFNGCRSDQPNVWESSQHGHWITWREKQKVEGIFGWIYPKTLNVWCILTYIYHLNYLNLNRPSIEYPMLGNLFSTQPKDYEIPVWTSISSKHVTPKSVKFSLIGWPLRVFPYPKTDLNTRLFLATRSIATSQLWDWFSSGNLDWVPGSRIIFIKLGDWGPAPIEFPKPPLYQNTKHLRPGAQPDQLLICSSFIYSRKNCHPLLICSSLSTSQLSWKLET